MKVQFLTKRLTLLLFLLSLFSFNSMAQSSDMLKPIIITLAIPEKDKNSEEVISAMQEKILQRLKPFKVENITRYKYSPLLALSVDQDGLEMLESLDDIVSITQDGLSAPQTKQQDSSQEAKDPPCSKE